VPERQLEILDRLIDFLSDGKTHSLTEISTFGQLRKYSITQITMMLNLLSEPGFIETNQTANSTLEAKISPSFAEFWQKINQVERGDATSKKASSLAVL